MGTDWSCIHYSETEYSWRRGWQKKERKGRKKKNRSGAVVPYPSYPGCCDQPLLPHGPGSLDDDWLLGELR